MTFGDFISMISAFIIKIIEWIGECYLSLINNYIFRIILIILVLGFIVDIIYLFIKNVKNIFNDSN